MTESVLVAWRSTVNRKTSWYATNGKKQIADESSSKILLTIWQILARLGGFDPLKIFFIAQVVDYDAGTLIA